ncbi:hypothetical protein PAJ34TS1_18820 [Paenibacillus azoreducens]|uniref:Uncharacterized protein n=1 Tax=Paenibacillus azoreducens TaxID=116718 RepID=A0A919YJ75_9BACL|nr:hypothetical protein J34TS1_40620 [Paenibacillus azoreducens]
MNEFSFLYILTAIKEHFAKIQGATFNQQYIERNGLVRLYIVPGSGWDRILQNPEI